MLSANVYIPINAKILVLVEEIKDYLETQLLIQSMQQDVIENAIVALRTQYKITVLEKGFYCFLSDRILFLIKKCLYSI